MIKKSLKILPMIILSTCLYGFDFLDNVVEGYQNVKDTFKKGMEIGEASRWAYLSSRLFPEHMEEPPWPGRPQRSMKNVHNLGYSNKGGVSSLRSAAT